MPTKRDPKKKSSKQPGTKRGANGRGVAVAEARVSALPDVTGDTTLDREVDYYLAHLPEWSGHEGQHVLIHGAEPFGFFATRDAALQEGLRRFGWVPFLVKQVQRDEEPIQLGRVIF